MRKTLLLLLMLLFCGFPVIGTHFVPLPAGSAQSGPSCTISAYIFKSDNVTPVVGAKVTIVKALKDGANVLFSVSPTSTQTDSTGHFSITAPRGPNSIIWVNAPTQGFNVSGGKPVEVPPTATATLQFMQAVTNPPAFLSVLVPTQTEVQQAGVLFASAISKFNFASGVSLTESPSGQLNVTVLPVGGGLTEEAPVSSGTYVTSLATGYLLTGPANDGLYRSSTGNLGFPNSNVGIKTVLPQSTFDVNGSMSVGSYAGTAAAPTNGIIVSGRVGIGTDNPSTGLEVAGIVTGERFNATLGVGPDAAGIKHKRVSTGSVSGGATALVTVTWTTPFADALYTVTASMLDSTSSISSLSVIHVESVTAENVTVRVANNSGGSLTGTLHVIGMHD